MVSICRNVIASMTSERLKEAFEFANTWVIHPAVGTSLCSLPYATARILKPNADPISNPEAWQLALAVTTVVLSLLRSNSEKMSKGAYSDLGLLTVQLLQVLSPNPNASLGISLIRKASFFGGSVSILNISRTMIEFLSKSNSQTA